MALLRGIKGCLPLEQRKIFSNAHILQHIDYCSTVWGNSPHVHSLVLAQKQVVRTILDVRGRAIRDPENRFCVLLAKLGWMDIHNRINFRTAVIGLKSLNNLAPPSI